MACLKNALVRDVLVTQGSNITWDVRFFRAAQDWKIDLITKFMDLLYSVNISQVEADAICWFPSSHKIFEVNSYYKLLQGNPVFSLEKGLEISSTIQGELLHLDSGSR